MISFAHIINPVQVDESSDLFIAQPITFETMRMARQFSEGTLDVTLYAIQHQDETRILLPDCFRRIPDLTRTVIDIKTFIKKKELPLIKDILDALFETADHADYLIYTNVDIALQPYFYKSISKMIEQGYDAFVINRRTISGRYSNPKQISLMFAEIGEPHPGYDCFVFKRGLYPQFKLGTICIGTAWIGRALLANMAAYAGKFKEFRNEHLTFHIGDAQKWRQDDYQDYFLANLNEYLTLFSQLEAEQGRFEPVLRSYLLDTGDKRPFPSFE
jgi:hypothetical protein